MASIRSSIPRPDSKSRSAPYTHRRRNSAPSTPGSSHSYLPVPSATSSSSRSSSKSPRDSGVAFVLDRPRTPQSGLPVRRDEAIPRIQARTSRTAHTSKALLTPASVVPRTGEVKDEVSPSVRKLQTLTQKSGRLIRVSPYMKPHISDACTAGSLIHSLHPCGHKVITRTPEACASNCQREYNEKTLRWANAVITKECFVCAACVNMHTQEHRQTQLQSLEARFARTEARMGHFRPEWVKKQMSYARRVLDNDLEKEQKEFEKLGRPCMMISGEPLVSIDERAAKVTAARIPWPPRQSPKQSRSPGNSTPQSLLRIPGSAPTPRERRTSLVHQKKGRY